MKKTKIIFSILMIGGAVTCKAQINSLQNGQMIGSGSGSAHASASAGQNINLVLSKVIIIQVGTLQTGISAVGTANATHNGNNIPSTVEEVHVKSNTAYNITIASSDPNHAIKTNKNQKDGMISVQITDVAKENHQPSLLIPVNPTNTRTMNNDQSLYVSYKMERETASATTNIVYTATQA